LKIYNILQKYNNLRYNIKISVLFHHYHSILKIVVDSSAHIENLAAENISYASFETGRRPQNGKDTG
jgi:hypothetical protein